MSTFHPVFLVATALVGCSCGAVTDPDDISNKTPTGALQILLATTPSTQGVLPAGVEEVWVRFEDVQVRSEDEKWITIGDDRRDINLMALRGASAPVSIGSADVFEGPYDALTLLMADAWIVVDGDEQELAITRGSGVTGATNAFVFDVDYWVDENTTTSVLLTWDLDDALDGAPEAWTLSASADFDVRLD